MGLNKSYLNDRINDSKALGYCWWFADDPIVANVPADVAYGAFLDRWVIICNAGQSGNLSYYSDNLYTWEPGNTAADNVWRALCAGPDRFVAVGDTGTGNRAQYSLNGIDWTIGSSSEDNLYRDVCYASWLSLYVAIAKSGTNRVMTSPDGETWTARSAPLQEWNRICASESLQLLIAVSSTGSGQRVMTSPDGETWTLRSTPIDIAWNAVCWSEYHQRAVALSYDGAERAMYSPDGINWSLAYSSAKPNAGWTDIVATEKEFVGCASDNNTENICYSPDGKGWIIPVEWRIARPGQRLDFGNKNIVCVGTAYPKIAVSY